MVVTQKQSLQISLVIPIKNESDSIASLIKSINKQTYSPDEIILVDGGSTDDTVRLALRLTENDVRYRVIRAGEASPGRGRNVGTKTAKNEWIAFTDAGIKLKNIWLEKLVEALNKTPEPDIVYGNYSPIKNTFFEKCAVFAYVIPQGSSGIRGKSIVSVLLRKKVWQKVGGFPDSRAAEDLMFMDEVERQAFLTAYAPEAMVYWQLLPDFISTFRKFVLYSKHNVWVKRQWQWHYGIARQYLLLSPFIILGFLHSFLWFLVIAGWLFIRTAKRIFNHRYEFGWSALFNPFTFFVTMLLILVIDLATFTGWIQAIFHKKPD